MDGVNEVPSKPPPHSPPVLNGHIPQLSGNELSNDPTTSSLSSDHPFTTNTTTNSLNFNGALNSNDSETALSSRVSVESDMSLGVGGLPDLPFPLPDIEGTLLDSDFNLSSNQLNDLDVGDGSSGSGFSFDSSVFNDDLVNTAIWSIGGSNPTNLGNDVPEELELQEPTVDLGNEAMPPEDISILIVPPNDDQQMPLENNTGSEQPIPPESNIGQVIPPDGEPFPPDIPTAPHVGVYCIEEDGFDDNFGTPTNPFIDSSGATIDPFVDAARNRALSTITEGFEDEDEDKRFQRSGSYNLDKVLTAFASANEFVRLNSEPKERSKETNGWVDFDASTEVTAASDWLNKDSVGEDSRATPTVIVGGESSGVGGASEEPVGSPVSDGNQVGVSPETVEGSLTKPIGDSWQSVSSEDDVINNSGKTPSSSNQQELSTESTVIDSQTTNPSTTSDKVNPSTSQFNAAEEPRPQLRAPSPSESDESGEYMRLADFHISPVNTEAPASAITSTQQREAGESAGEVEPTTSSLPSPTVVIVTEGDSTRPDNIPSNKSTGENSHSDSHSSGTGIGTTTIAAAAVVTASTVSSAVAARDENNCDTTSPVHASSREELQNQPSSLDGSPGAQQSQQNVSSGNDQNNSSLDTGDKGATSSNLDSCPRESNLDSSNLDAGMRRKKQPNSSTPPSQRRSHPATNLPILSPLSPEHGGSELNEQYEFLRRTLSHSQRRFSERRRQRGQEGSGGRRRANVPASNDPEEKRKQTVGQLRDLLRKSEVQPNQSPEGRQAHVDHHGRTYYMDHNTRTIAYNGGQREGGGGERRREEETGDRGTPERRNPRDMQTRREMLDRRYQSLQRSFRRSNDNRPRRQQRAGLTTSVVATGGNIDNNSLTLTRQEAEAMMRSQSSARSSGVRSLLSRGSRTSSSVTERSSNRKQRSGSGSKTRWLFGRKSSKTISQQSTTSGEDDFLPVFSPTGEGEARLSQTPPTAGGEAGTGDESSATLSPPTSEGQRLPSQSSVASVESQTPLIPPSDSDSRAARVNEAVAVGVAVAASTTSDNEQEPTRSTAPSDGELVRSAEVSTRSVETSLSPSDEQQPLIGVVVTSPRESLSSETPTTAVEERQQTTQESSGGVEGEGVEAIPNASPAIGEMGRQSTIVRASGLSSDDRDAAVRARQRARTRSQVGGERHRRNTDELTNEAAGDFAMRSRGRAAPEQLVVTVAASSTRQEGDEQSPSSREVVAAESGASKDKEIEAEEAVPKTKSRSSRRSQRAPSRGLYVSPGLRFITRKDLYTFLTSAGHAGEEFFANRALMELVQRIRADNSLFEKYQHSRHLVTTLNQFADVKADLPSNWEKKLNKEGKIFFIDHDHELTTFVDPRLPLPNQHFTYTPIQSTVPSRRVSYDETGLRPHHTTTVRHSLSLDSDVAVGPPTTPTTTTSPTQGNSLAPPSSSSSPSRVSTVSESSAGGGVGESNARPRVASESVAPPTYEEQVVAFFRQSDIVAIISGRYHRGVRPQLRDIIAGIRMEGTTALERIQMSGSIATYELAIVLSLFEEEISRMNPQAVPAQPLPPTLNVVSPQPTTPTAINPSTPTTPGSPGKSINVAALSTLQRQKLDFATKLQNFKIMMTRVGFSQGSRLKFNIRRDHLLEDAYEHVMKSNLKHLQMKRLNISFKGEEGLDYGGPSREFFFLLSREIFNPYYGLFEYSANDTYTVQISPTSSFIHNNMEWFRFGGRIVGLVIAQGFLLDVFFTRTVYKSLLCKPPHLKDLEALEPAFYNSLLWIQENDPEPLDLTFTVEEEAFGQINSHELKPGGVDVLVTEENKHEYIDLMLRWRLDRGVAKQMESFKKGFCEVMPVNLLYNFDAQELEFLTAGTLEIDVDDWREHTEYRNGYHAAHQVVLWFWQAVETFDNEQRLRLLQFVTGTSSVPFEGFKALRGSNGPKRFTIDFFNDVNAFPRTHTCFNRIDLPPYPSFEVLYEKLRFAVEEGGGFGIE